MPEPEFVPDEWKCSVCGVRRGMLENINPEVVVSISATDPPLCPVDNSVMKPLTWRDAAEEAGRIAARWMRWMRRSTQLEDAWPEGYSMPVEG